MGWGSTTQTTLNKPLPIVYKTQAAWLLGDDVTSATGWDTDEPTYNASLDMNISAFMEAAWRSGSPFADAYAYDPNDDLDYIQDSIDRFFALVDALDPDTDWEAMFNAALNAANTAFAASSATIAARVAAYDSALANALARAQSRITAAAFDAMANEGSGMMEALAMSEADRLADRQSFTTELERMNESARLSGVTTFTAQMAEQRQLRLAAERDLHTIIDGLRRLTIVANKEFYAEDVELGYKDAVWDLSLFQYGVAVLGTSGPMLPVGPSKASTALSTALTWASTGVQLGSAGGTGTAVAGGLVGALGGLIAGMA